MCNTNNNHTQQTHPPRLAPRSVHPIDRNTVIRHRADRTMLRRRTGHQRLKLAHDMLVSASPAQMRFVMHPDVDGELHQTVLCVSIGATTRHEGRVWINRAVVGRLRWGTAGSGLLLMIHDHAHEIPADRG